LKNLTLDAIRADIARTVRTALAEDIDTGDITAELIAPEADCTARVITRERCTVCGAAWVDEVFKQLGGVHLNWKVEDGDEVAADTPLLHLHGNARAILTGERTALNFLQCLSGTATQNHTWTAYCTKICRCGWRLPQPSHWSI